MWDDDVMDDDSLSDSEGSVEYTFEGSRLPWRTNWEWWWVDDEEDGGKELPTLYPGRSNPFAVAEMDFDEFEESSHFETYEPDAIVYVLFRLDEDEGEEGEELEDENTWRKTLDEFLEESKGWAFGTLDEALKEAERRNLAHEPPR